MLKTTTPMPAASAATVKSILDITGFTVGDQFDAEYQLHTRDLRVGTYALHLPSGKAGIISGIAFEKQEVMGRIRNTKVYGISYDSEYSGSVLRRITPKQYHSLPQECKITSVETGIF